MYVFTSKEYEVLQNPLTQDQIRERMDEYNFVEGVIEVQPQEMIDNNIEDFLDLISERLLVDSYMFMDIGYRVVGCVENDCVLMLVSGDVSEVLENKDEDEEG